ncbi:CocE/NonD family hydrolase [bacterium]|nr:CocE/NonD family hydrolase [bacterium]
MSLLHKHIVIIGLLLLVSCGGSNQNPAVPASIPAVQVPAPSASELSRELPAPTLSDSLMATPLYRGTSDISGMAGGWTPNVYGSGNFSQDGTALVIDTGAKQHVSALYRLVFADGTIYEKQVPYIYPYELHINTDNAGPVYVMLPDYGKNRWVVHDGQAQSGSKIIVPAGMSGNHGNESGSIVFGLVAWDGSDVRIESIDLILPDIPSAGQPVDYHQFIEAADGTLLATDIFLPYAETNPFIPDPPYPAVLIRTPYSKAIIDNSIIKPLTDINVVVMVQYFRGRLSDSGGWPDSGGTEGLFDDHNGPEHYDAIDTVDWLEARNWYRGQLVASGPSALGLWIYQAAPGLGDRLAGWYPQVSCGNVAEWAMVDNGVLKQSNVEIFLGTNGYPAELLQYVLANFSDPQFVEQFDYDNRADDVQSPAYHETGWWDVEVDATIDSWQALNDNGGVGAAGKQWLIIGPWNHESVRLDTTGDLVFPTTGRNDATSAPSLVGSETWEGVEWAAGLLTFPLKSAPANHVLAYFVGEEGNTTAPQNTWYEFADWPPAFSAEEWFLTDSGTLAGAPDSGEQELSFTLDPANPITTLGGNFLLGPFGEGLMLAGPYDQAPLLPNADILQFTGPEIVDPVSIAGPVMVDLNVATDAMDTDVCVKLVDRYPDGTLMLVSDNVMRLSFSDPAYVAGSTANISFNLGSRAYVFGAGHKLELHIQGSNFPKYNPNPGNGDDYYDSSNPGTAVEQHNSLKMGTLQPSKLVLPVYNPAP